jgi:iron complex transport system substrate-binding protein
MRDRMRQPGKMSSGHWSRRGFLLGGVALPFALTGCLDKKTAERTAVESQAFPTTLRHALGTTTISKDPGVVATLGWSSQDICVELGVLPAGYAVDSARGYGTPPWFSKAVSQLDALLPRNYHDDAGLPWGDLHDIRPDLILAVNAVFAKNATETADAYSELSKIAPTIAWPGRPRDTDWRTATSMVAQALGRPASGKALITATEKAISDAAGAYQDLAGATVLCIEARSVPGASFEVHTVGSNAMRVLKDFGLRPAPGLERIVASATPHDTDFGPRTVYLDTARAEELDADVVVVGVRPEEKDQIMEGPVLAGIPAAKRGSTVVLTTDLDFLALLAASPTSIKWAIQTVMPRLARGAYLARTSK